MRREEREGTLLQTQSRLAAYPLSLPCARSFCTFFSPRFRARFHLEGDEEGGGQSPKFLAFKRANPERNFRGIKRGIMDTGDVLLKRTIVDPEDEALRLVYADWLDERASERGEEVPCPRAKFVRMGFHPGWIPVTPTPFQMAFLANEGREAHYLGGANYGKTTALLMAALRGATNPKYRGLLVAPTNDQLQIIAGRLNEWLVKDGFYAARWRGVRELQFHHGARLQLGSGTDWNRYIAAEYDFVGIDGASAGSGSGVKELKLRARLRNVSECGIVRLAG